MGHRATHKATCCLLDDRNILDKQPFTFEHDCQPFKERINDDVPMDSISNEEESGKESEDDGVGYKHIVVVCLLIT